MSVDERVAALLEDLANQARPGPDPYARVLDRFRRSRRRRAAAAGLGLVAAAAVAATAIAVPSGDRDRTARHEDSWTAMLRWAERLRESPPRGAVAADRGYAVELARIVLGHQRGGAFRLAAPVTKVSVLYVDDIGESRIALVAFDLQRSDQTKQWPYAHAWFAAPRGATAAELADPKSTAGARDGLEPFATISQLERADGHGEPVTIGLAPDGCVIETAPLPAVSDWRAEPTDSYIVRTVRTTRAEWWRVVCDGAIKEMLPAPTFRHPGPLTEEQLNDALKHARGDVDRELARAEIDFDLHGNGYSATRAPSVVWGGRLTGTKPDSRGSFDGRAVLVAAPHVMGGWVGRLSVTFDESPSRATSDVGRGTSFWSEADPTDLSVMSVVRLGTSETVAVVAPKTATSVRAVAGGQVVASAPVKDDAAVLDAPATPDLFFEAVDAAGAVVASARTHSQPPITNLYTWD